MSNTVDDKIKEIEKLRIKQSEAKAELDDIIDRMIKSLPVTEGNNIKDPGSKLPLDSVREFEDYDKGEVIDFVLGTIELRQWLRRQKDQKTEELSILDGQIREAELDLIIEQTKALESSLGESKDGYREV